MENQILDDNAFKEGVKGEETMRNNIDRANYAIYAQGAVFVLTVIILLTNILFLIEVIQDVEVILFTNDILGGIVSIVMLTGFVLFLMWFRRAYKNIQIIGYETKHTDGWAVGGFFVPILAI